MNPTLRERAHERLGSLRPNPKRTWRSLSHVTKIAIILAACIALPPLIRGIGLLPLSVVAVAIVVAVRSRRSHKV